MSSIVGHATAGFTVFLCCRDAHGSSKRMAVIYVVLATCADLDYLAIWGQGYAAHPRVTHSILFALAAPVLARIALRSRDASTAPIAGLLIASLSHPVLDLLVGVHGVPMLWPWRSEVSFPIGVLPSAGALDPTNYFFLAQPAHRNGHPASVLCTADRDQGACRTRNYLATWRPDRTVLARLRRVVGPTAALRQQTCPRYNKRPPATWRRPHSGHVRY